MRTPPRCSRSATQKCSNLFPGGAEDPGGAEGRGEGKTPWGGVGGKGAVQGPCSRLMMRPSP
jgi:hypothetical protein